MEKKKMESCGIIPKGLVYKNRNHFG